MTTTNHKPHRPSVSRFYRTGTFVFLGISVVLAGAITALALSKTVVTVKLENRNVTSEIAITAVAEPKTNSDEIKGVVLTATAEETVTVEVPSDGPSVDDFARGTVRIVNTWTQVQPLAAGTRLQAESNQLIYRTVRRVDVPSGGSVEVEVVADTAGATGNVEPDRFTIVALWPGLQNQIYGQSTVTFTGGTRSAGVLTQALIDERSKTLLDSLTTAAAAKLPAIPAGLRTYGQPTITSSGTSTATKPGAEVASFQLRGTVTVVAVAVDPSVIESLARQAIVDQLTTGEQTVSDVSLTLKTTEHTASSAKLTLTASTSARLSTASPQLASSRMTRKTKTELLAELRGTPGVADATIMISPFWTSRTPSTPASIRVLVSE